MGNGEGGRLYSFEGTSCENLKRCAISMTRVSSLLAAKSGGKRQKWNLKYLPELISFLFLIVYPTLKEVGRLGNALFW